MWKKNNCLFFIFFLLAIFTSSSSFAAVQRFAIVVGNNNGGMGKIPLKYAEKDAQGMYALLKDLSKIPHENILILQARDAVDTLAALENFRKLIYKSSSKKDETLFIFYYSGHGDVEVLRMGNSALPLDELKKRIKAMPAKVKIAILDACHSGGLTLMKGGQKSAPFEVMLDNQLEASGEVYISSSTAVETSLESDDLAASYFSYYLNTGLRGAADTNTDKKVSLNEAYHYAYQKTVEHSAEAIGPVQHPSFQYDLRGKGDIILTDLSQKTSAFSFPEKLQGTFFIYDVKNGSLISELQKEPGRGIKLALSEGNYRIKMRRLNTIYEKDFHIGPHQTLEISMTDALKTPYRPGGFKRSVVLNYASPPASGDSLLLQEGQIIKLRLLENLSSKTSYIGEKINLDAANDVFVDGVLIIKQGAKAIGEVIEVKKGTGSFVFSSKGFLKIKLKYVEAANGQIIPLSSIYAKKGKGAKLYNPKYLRGSIFDAFVKENVEIKVAKKKS